MRWILALIMMLAIYNEANATISVIKHSTLGEAVASSIPTSFGTLPSAGNTVFGVCFTTASIAPSSFAMADNQGVGNTYTLDLSESFAGSTNPTVNIFRSTVLGATSGTFTVTLTITGGSSNNGGCIAIEVSGLGTATLDKTVKTTGTSATEDTTASPTTTQSAEYVVAAVANDSGGSGSWAINVTGSNPTNFVQEGDDPSGSSFTAGSVVDTVVASTGAFRHVWTYGGSQNYAVALATYYNPSGSGGGGGGSASTCNLITCYEEKEP